MNTQPPESKQVVLAQQQIEAFYSDKLTNDQVEHFIQLTRSYLPHGVRFVVDVGGGCGHFARELAEKTGLVTRVVDTDLHSIERCRLTYGEFVQAELGDALRPNLHGDEDVVCFNLVLHHLVGKNEEVTRNLQKQALRAWKDQAKLIFVSEYIYESYISDVSGRMIYEITSSPLLSFIAKKISAVVKPLRANTFGVGVRFRSQREWIRLFGECGFDVLQAINGKPESFSTIRKLLLIKSMKKDSFLLRPRAAR